MSSQNEGRVILALQAYRGNQILSLRATAKAYDVPFATLRARHSGILPRAQTTTKSRHSTNDEDKILSGRFYSSQTKGSLPSVDLLRR
jgi:hypothetical protein